MLIALEDSRELLALLHVCLLTVTLPLQNKIELVGTRSGNIFQKCQMSQIIVAVVTCLMMRKRLAAVLRGNDNLSPGSFKKSVQSLSFILFMPTDYLSHWILSARGLSRILASESRTRI